MRKSAENEGKKKILPDKTRYSGLSAVNARIEKRIRSGIYSIEEKIKGVRGIA